MVSNHKKTLKNKVSLIEIYEQFLLYSIKRSAHGCQWKLNLVINS